MNYLHPSRLGLKRSEHACQLGRVVQKVEEVMDARLGFKQTIIRRQLNGFHVEEVAYLMWMNHFSFTKYTRSCIRPVLISFFGGVGR